MKSIVISGASTGIGEACALRLDKMGYRVFAGVRREADGEALQEKASANLSPIMLDVTDADQIAAAAQTVGEQTGQAGLAGLINNAGVAVGGPLEFVALEDLRWQLEVNVVGQVAVTQAFVPLLRQDRGRVVNMSSIAGRAGNPFLGPYSASKFALEALSDALRVELHPWGIDVIVIEPGEIATPIWQKSLAAAEKRFAKMPPRVNDLYGPVIKMMMKMARNAGGIPADEVAKAVAHAFTAARPKTRYVVGRDAKLRVWIERLPDRLRDRVIISQLPKYGP
ncbi:MAG: SDR family oxidoreductase [Anaerolineae bacterium]|nr:SDR family oxidoreductase [Anaerolineae bacterium]